VKGRVLRPGESQRGHYSYGVDGDYFAAMGFSLREGRFLTADESRRPERVCVVDEDFARYYWPHSEAVGQLVFQGPETGSDAAAFTIVGVVGAVKQAGLTDQTAQGAVYYPYTFRNDNSFFLILRATVPPESLALTLQKIVRQADPELPVSDLRSMDTRIADSLVVTRSPALVAGIFSLIALLLTAVGTYGVLSYAVTQRRREIGVRMALGASEAGVLWMVVKRGLALILTGIAIGTAAALALARVMASLLMGVSNTDMGAFGGVLFILTAAALLACYIPARKAARTDPTVALRYE
jgi:predicted permease